MSSADRSDKKSRESYVIFDKWMIVGVMIGSWSVTIVETIFRQSTGAGFGFSFGVSALMGWLWLTGRKNKKKVMEYLDE